MQHCVPPRMKLISLFQDNELKITVKSGKTSIIYFDNDFRINSSSYQPYRKPKDESSYVDRKLNHPPTILSKLPQTISKRYPHCHITSKSSPKQHQPTKEHKKTKVILKESITTAKIRKINHKETENETLFDTSILTTKVYQLT